MGAAFFYLWISRKRRKEAFRVPIRPHALECELYVDVWCPAADGTVRDWAPAVPASRKTRVHPTGREDVRLFGHVSAALQETQPAKCTISAFCACSRFSA